MPQNGINHPGITALATAVQHNPSLRVINLNDNTFTKKGAVAMAQVWFTLWLFYYLTTHLSSSKFLIFKYFNCE